MTIMEWDLYGAIGRLMTFWWWCVDYAEDGDLTKHNEIRIGSAVGLNGDLAIKFYKTMIKVKFIDEIPYLRVHDWWVYFGKFLQIKYKHNPEKWKKIRDLYEINKNGSKKRSKKGSRNHIPNLTLPNQPNLTIGVKDMIGKYCNMFKEKYGQMPHISPKDAGIAKRLSTIPDIELILDQFFTSKDKFIVDNCHAMNIIESQINKLMIKGDSRFTGIKEWLEEKEKK